MNHQRKMKRTCYTVLAAAFLCVSAWALKTGTQAKEAERVPEMTDENVDAATLPQNAHGEQDVSVKEPVSVPQRGLYAGITEELGATEYAVVEANKEMLVAAANQVDMLLEKEVFSFLQGPKSWGEGRAWSGAWSGEYVRGNYFGNFGCGLCCMANIYSTFSGNICSPWDMFEYAKKASNYMPTGSIGAIGWDDMNLTLRKCGFDTELRNKPQTYEQFRDQIAEAEEAVVLISSRDDASYWKNTGGHYVNICLYQEDTEEVFLADPADPDGNRSYIPLRYVYDALKTASAYQYLLVEGYSADRNQWGHDGIDEAWSVPDIIME